MDANEMQPQQGNGAPQEYACRQSGDSHCDLVWLTLENRELQEKLQEAECARDTLIEALSQDFRNLLAVVKVSANLLQQHTPTPVAAISAGGGDRHLVDDTLYRIDAASNTMHDLIQELEDFTCMLSGHTLELHPVAGDLVGLVGDLLDEQRQRTHRHTIQVESTIRELPGLWDSSRLRRAFSTLLTSAIERSPRYGDITVRVGKEDSGDWASLVVDAHGAATEDLHLPCLFEWRYQSDRPPVLDCNYIRLACARHVIEQHGGSIAAGSGQGTGTRFEVRLPTNNQVWVQAC